MSVPETSTTAPDGPDTPAPEPAYIPPAPAAPLHTGRLWAFALAGAIVAGLVSFAAFEATPTVFIPPPNMVRMMGSLVNAPKIEHVNAADRKNAMIAFGVAGGTFALALGLAGGMARRSPRAALVGMLAGLVLGAGIGVGAGAVALPAYQKQYTDNPESVTKDMTFPLLIHAGIWAAMGAAAATALGIGAGARGRLPSVILGGLIGGAIGGGLYEVIAALGWADARTYEPIAARWAPRLVASLAGPLVATIIAVSGLISEPRKTKPAAIHPENLS